MPSERLRGMLPMMRKLSQPDVRAMAPRPAPAAGWVYDTQKSTLNTFVACTLLLYLILPPNLDYATLIATANTTPSEQTTSITSRIILVGLMLLSCALILRRPALWTALLRTVNPFYIAFVLLAAASVAWSIDTAETLPHVFRLVVYFLCFSAFTLNGWRANRYQSVVRTLLGVIVVGSLIFAVLLPQWGVQKFLDFAPVMHNAFSHSYTIAPDEKPVLRGLTFGKNQMGQLASLALVFWFHGWLGKETKNWLAALCMGSAVICLYWAHSSTSVLAAAFALPFMLMLRHWPHWLRRYMPYILTTFTILILGYSLVVLRLFPQLDFLLYPITAITGKDLTFTNRTDIWHVVNAHIIQHPLLGTGYSAYWTEKPNSPSHETVRLLFFYPGQAHNGYLDVINDLGIVGGLVLIGFLFVYLRQSLKIMTFDRHVGSLYLALLFHQFWSSLSESHWFSWSSAAFTIMTMAVFGLARTLLQRRIDLAAARTAPTPKAAAEADDDDAEDDAPAEAPVRAPRPRRAPPRGASYSR
jgi:exopolysaccharide production protein ExoQ